MSAGVSTADPEDNSQVGYAVFGQMILAADEVWNQLKDICRIDTIHNFIFRPRKTSNFFYREWGRFFPETFDSLQKSTKAIDRPKVRDGLHRSFFSLIRQENGFSRHTYLMCFMFIMGRAVLDIKLLLEQLGTGDLVSDAGFLGILFKIVLRHHGRCLTDYFFHRFSNFDYSMINKRFGYIWWKSIFLRQAFHYRK